MFSSYAVPRLPYYDDGNSLKKAWVRYFHWMMVARYNHVPSSCDPGGSIGGESHFLEWIDHSPHMYIGRVFPRDHAFRELHVRGGVDKPLMKKEPRHKTGLCIDKV